jgi:hypothetical protein
LNRLVDRFGRTGTAALTSLIWALPMAAWAGSSDLSPIDKTAYPGVALSIGVVMLIVWLVLLTRLSRIPVAPRQRRLDLAQMSRSEKRWTLAAVAFGAGLIAWLNAGATVDWAPLFAAGLAVFLIAMLAGIAISWRRSRSAFQRRRSAGTLE